MLYGSLPHLFQHTTGVPFEPNGHRWGLAEGGRIPLAMPGELRCAPDIALSCPPLGIGLHLARRS